MNWLINYIYKQSVYPGGRDMFDKSNAANSKAKILLANTFE